MNRDLPSLTNQVFDVLIVGGGILGAGIARDAALRGLRVALVEKADFASGTSSRSTKLIHGGFRYLEQYDFRLVIESCRERRILQEIAPHIVHTQPFLLPVYNRDPRSLLLMRLGMTIYDLLALYRNTAPHKSLTPDQALHAEPALARDGLKGAIQFYDCQNDDARFCVENLVHAAEHGAISANYCEVTAFTTRDDRVISAQVTDRISSDQFDIQARFFINATGPWIEQMTNLTPFSNSSVRLRPTKGVHLVIPRLTRNYGIFFQARRDGRMMFIIPWNDVSLVGTTDTDFSGPTDEAQADPEDVDYLLKEVASVLPETSIKQSDIITTFAGVRALLDSTKNNPSSRTREHRIVQHGINLLSIVGGKYTTYRAIAQQTVDQVYKLTGMTKAQCTTAKTLIPNHRPPQEGEKIASSPPIYQSDIIHTCKNEMAMTVSDIMRRRTPLALSKHGIPEVAEKVANHMASVMKWTKEQKEHSLQQYRAEWEMARP